jgi:hypothetical protein
MPGVGPVASEKATGPTTAVPAERRSFGGLKAQF